MNRIRLRRTGKAKQPCYRVVVADSRSPRDGKFIEIIGHYNPTQQPKVLEVKKDRARYWLSVGAKPSEVVVHLFKKVNVLDNNGKIIPESEDEGAALAEQPAAGDAGQTPSTLQPPASVLEESVGSQ